MFSEETIEHLSNDLAKKLCRIQDGIKARHLSEKICARITLDNERHLLADLKDELLSQQQLAENEGGDAAAYVAPHALSVIEDEIRAVEARISEHEDYLDQDNEDEVVGFALLDTFVSKFVASAGLALAAMVNSAGKE